MRRIVRETILLSPQARAVVASFSEVTQRAQAEEVAAP